MFWIPTVDQVHNNDFEEQKKDKDKKPGNVCW